MMIFKSAMNPILTYLALTSAPAGVISGFMGTFYIGALTGDPIIGCLSGAMYGVCVGPLLPFIGIYNLRYLLGNG